MTVLTVAELRVFAPDLAEEKGEAMIADAVAQATIAAPCLARPDELTALQVAQFKAVLRAAVLRWHDSGAGGVTSTTTSRTRGPYTDQETTTVDAARRGLFWPSEIEQLAQVCSGGRKSGTVDVRLGGPGVLR
jgi:hypothetical protein